MAKGLNCASGVRSAQAYSRALEVAAKTQYR